MAFNFELSYEDNEFNISIPVKIKPIKAVNLVEALNVKAQTNDGKSAKYISYIMDSGEIKRIAFKRGWIDEEGNLRAKQEIQFYIELEGEKKFIKPFLRGKKLEINMTIPKENLEQFLTEKRYEVYSDKSDMLWKLAQRLIEKKSIAITKMSFGGFKEYYALIRPVVKNKRFVMIMDLATQKVELENLMDIDKKEEVKTELPTITELSYLSKPKKDK